MKRLVMIVSLVLVLTAFKPAEEFSKSISKDKKLTTIALIHHRYLYFIRVKLNNRDAHLLVDTGAAASLLDINQANDYNFQFRLTDNKFAGVGGVSNQYKVSKYVFEHDSIPLKVYPLGANLKHVVESFSEGGINIAGVLGSDFMINNDAIIDYKNKQLIIHH